MTETPDRHGVTDADLFDVPDLPGDDIPEADRVSDGIPLEVGDLYPDRAEERDER